MESENGLSRSFPSVALTSAMVWMCFSTLGVLRSMVIFSRLPRRRIQQRAVSERLQAPSSCSVTGPIAKGMTDTVTVPSVPALPSLLLSHYLCMATECTLPSWRPSSVTGKPHSCKLMLDLSLLFGRWCSTAVKVFSSSFIPSCVSEEIFMLMLKFIWHSYRRQVPCLEVWLHVFLFSAAQNVC